VKKPFKVGEEIIAYHYGKRFLGKIILIETSGNLRVLFTDDTETPAYITCHPKQCRRLKPKESLLEKAMVTDVIEKAKNIATFDSFLKEPLPYPDELKREPRRIWVGKLELEDNKKFFIKPRLGEFFVEFIEVIKPKE